MIIELLLILILLWLATRTYSRTALKVDPRYQKLHMIGMKLNEICLACEIDIEYEVNISDTSTYVENKKDIYLVIANEAKKIYDDNTLLHAAIHEMTHVYCPSLTHDELFESMEHHFLKKAEELGYFDFSVELDPEYPCLDGPEEEEWEGEDKEYEEYEEDEEEVDYSIMRK